MNKGGMGVGYASLIMIFAVICLAVLAVMSYQAAGANDLLNEKSVAYTKEYYAADTAAKEMLAKLDKAAFDAAQGFFDSDFEAYCADIEGVKLTAGLNGVTAEFTQPINSALGIKVVALFYAMPMADGRYRIIEYKTVSASAEQQDQPLGVWDGTILN